MTYYTCVWCGKTMKRPVPHKCNGNPRKRHLKFKQMDKTKLKQSLTILQAYADGKAIECWEDGEWVDAEEISPFEVISMVPHRYRIKSEVMYRAFDNADECWNEMLRHEPFGVIRDVDGNMHAFGELHAEWIDFFDITGEDFLYFFENAKFADGKPFGVPTIEDSEPSDLPL